jgi:hypothetical protein
MKFSDRAGRFRQKVLVDFCQLPCQLLEKIVLGCLGPFFFASFEQFLELFVPEQLKEHQRGKSHHTRTKMWFV